MAEELDVPQRLLIFTRPHCPTCAPTIRIVNTLVHSFFSKVYHVNIVDLDQKPEIREKYGIMGVPCIMINEEIVYQPVLHEVSKTEIYQVLLNNAVNVIVDRQSTLDARKETLLFLNKNIYDSIMQEKLIRSIIGDYIHLGVLQQIIISLVALDNLVPHLLYQSGLDVGRFGIGSNVLIALNPNIGLETRSDKRFLEVMKGFVKYFGDNESMNIPMKLATAAKVIDCEPQYALLRIDGLASASGAPYVGEPLCHFTAGEIAGITSVLTGKYSVVYETKCVAMGYDHCEFEIRISDEPINHNISDYQKDYITEDRRQHFQGVLYDISKRIHESFISPKDFFNREKIGNEVHFTRLQQAIIALKMSDPYCGSLLYSAGTELGIFGPGRDILQRYILDENFEWPLTLQQALEILNKFFHFGMIQAAKERADVKIVEEEDGELRIRIYEGAIASGVINSGMTFCDFTAGYLASRITLLTNKD
ncbi:MAG: hypothetical protein GF308_14045, partial [Candidatus Heimdallarchaeota archaeon]|nr:hypothetical protein [Candidatus Heimdallarchaeota archaeon]